MSGRWFFVCGPSGAGKDSVMALAQKIIGKRDDIVFARRLVTRPPHAGSDHDPVTEAEFKSLKDCGGLCWSWQAHGFYYGIAQHYEAKVQASCTVVINGSRAHVQTLLPSSDVRLIHIRADPNLLAQRLAQRGRDTASAVAERLIRSTGFINLKVDCLIVNNDELLVAAKSLADYLTHPDTYTSA